LKIACFEQKWLLFALKSYQKIIVVQNAQENKILLVHFATKSGNGVLYYYIEN